MKNAISFASILVLLSPVLLSCGDSSSPEELIVGRWDAENEGDTMHIEFRADGLVVQDDQPEQQYRIVSGDPDTLQIMSVSHGEVILELELEFQDDDHFTLSGGGMTANLTRMD